MKTGQTVNRSIDSRTELDTCTSFRLTNGCRVVFMSLDLQTNVENMLVAGKVKRIGVYPQSAPQA